jgi:hypothetical protein
MDLKTLIYIRSEAEFSRARSKGFWDVKRSLVTGHKPFLLPFDEAIKGLPATATIHLGLQDIPLKNIVGSAGRFRDFTRHFMPCLSDERSKERWRVIYTLAASGAGFPPVEVYKLGSMYFVQNGHHRVSVASYLDWSSIQAYVTVWPTLSGGAVTPVGQSQGRKGVN